MSDALAPPADGAQYPFHKGARTALYVAGALLILLLCTFPIGAFIIWRVGKARVTVSGTGLRAEGILTDELQFADVERIGILKVPLVARGIGGSLARMKLNNMDEGVNLVARLRGGKTVKFLLNQYERHEEIIEKVRAALPGLELEQVTMGALTWKWPERQG
jgi:hypothetical protein